MQEEILKEMAQAISSSLQLDTAAVLCILKDYWQDKVSQVWRVEQMFEAAHRTQKPITREGAILTLKDAIHYTDPDNGITLATLYTALEDYQLDFGMLRPERYGEVHGVFCVWRKSEVFSHQFGFFPGKISGNLPDALAFARKLAVETPGLPAYLACEPFPGEEAKPWLTILARDSQSEPSITEGECHVRME